MSRIKIGNHYYTAISQQQLQTQQRYRKERKPQPGRPMPKTKKPAGKFKQWILRKLNFPEEAIQKASVRERDALFGLGKKEHDIPAACVADLYGLDASSNHVFKLKKTKRGWEIDNEVAPMDDGEANFLIKECGGRTARTAGYWSEEYFSVPNHMGIENLEYELKEGDYFNAPGMEEAVALLTNANLEAKIPDLVDSYIQSLYDNAPSPDHFLDAAKWEFMQFVQKVVDELLGDWEDEDPYDTFQGGIDEAVKQLADLLTEEEWFGAIGGDPEYNDFGSKLHDLADAIASATKGNERSIFDQLESELWPAVAEMSVADKEWETLEENIRYAYEQAKEGVIESAQEIIGEDVEELQDELKLLTQDLERGMIDQDDFDSAAADIQHQIDQLLGHHQEDRRQVRMFAKTAEFVDWEMEVGGEDFTTDNELQEILKVYIPTVVENNADILLTDATIELIFDDEDEDGRIVQGVFTVTDTGRVVGSGEWSADITVLEPYKRYQLDYVRVTDWEEEAPPAPDDDDLRNNIVIQMARQGYDLGIEGTYVSTHVDVEDALRAAKEWGEENNIYLDIYYINERGNVDLVDEDGNIIQSWV